MPAPRLSPIGLRQFERVIHLSVQGSIPFTRLPVETNGKDTRLDSELQDGTSFTVGGTYHALLALVAPRGATGDVTKLGPR